MGYLEYNIDIVRLVLSNKCVEQEAVLESHDYHKLSSVMGNFKDIQPDIEFSK